MATVLIIDSDITASARIKKALCSHEFRVVVAESAAEGMRSVAEHKPELVLLDLVLPDMDGLLALEKIKSLSPETEVIVVTAYPSISHVVEAMKLGAADFLLKPFNLGELVNIIRQTLEMARIRRNSEARIKVSYEVLKALSHPLRRKIAVYLFSAGARRFSDIARSVDISDTSKLGFHLRVLMGANLLTKNRENLYMLTARGMASVEKLVHRLEGRIEHRR